MRTWQAIRLKLLLNLVALRGKPMPLTSARIAAAVARNRSRWPAIWIAEASYDRRPRTRDRGPTKTSIR
jgi:hypothetical protein